MIDAALKEQVVIDALTEMMRKGWLDICTINNCAEILNSPCKGSEAHQILQTLNCVNFANMTPLVRSSIPSLIKECLNIDFVGINFEPKPKQEKRGLFRVLTQ